jgi:flagellar hook-length control protein FliK
MPACEGRAQAPHRRGEASDHAAQRQSFGRLVDRLTRSDPAPESEPAATQEAVADTAITPAEGQASASDGPAAAPDNELPEVGPLLPTPLPTAPAPNQTVAAEAPRTAVLAATADMSQIEPAARTAAVPTPQVSSIQAAAAGVAIPATPEPAQGRDAVAGPTTFSQPAGEHAAVATTPADTPNVATAAMPVTRGAVAGPERRAVVSVDQFPPSASALMADQMEKPALAAAPAHQAAKGTINPAEADAVPALIAREERGPARAGDAPVVAFAGIDTPRSAAALYHQAAEAAARPGAETPTPVEQVSVRLLHAAAEGKRAIQVHLHPSELGAVDVKLQWQGDRLTAQFLVDRPETLQLLQREVPALERSLGQAGVNVDSGSLQFSLRQHQEQGRDGAAAFATARAGIADAADTATSDEPLGQVVREGLLSIRV